MNPLQLVKYDLYSIIKSPLTYFALILAILPQIGITYMFVHQNDSVPSGAIIGMAAWFFTVTGLLFVIKTITRDLSQGTIQLYMNKTKNRIGYIIAKTISIVLIAVLFMLILTIYTQIVQACVDTDSIKTHKYFDYLWFIILTYLFYGLFLFLIALIVPKPALIFTLGIFLIIIVPVADSFLPMIPHFGDKIKDALKYIPFGYIPEKTQGTDQTFSNWQWFITPASIVVLFVINLFYGAKKDI
ncbi:phenol-soluble modulin export ABC transporter permease subunit PmtD [Staphylococcus pettenkoferi]|uniref:ABC transporter permease subunit n=1 Tax=Staphylococcus pettenkoferi TaxID=170573 RepID=A0A9Q4H0G0_9STAP|nr:ABC transporter permease subunit [Staphylococcus pettenkoferi]MCY1570118.1 ABC transporter permease subunit [Staphylococcus pettenkoferi]MCY1576729.1 ABC transporter permease subunit [Staphylococcus pettenkoferi]MCY1595632.1 ABC transporter permease subunit [Staphylococcus pettenkoferi]MCY1618345.1 ABC transporter permease subunit [Staphylococcus pettenkoferi]